MSDRFKTHPGWENDPDIKKIDDALNENNFNSALGMCQEVADKLTLGSAKRAHAYVHKGVIYYRRNDLVSAVSMWKKALDLEPNEEDAIHNLNKIQSL